MVIVVGTLIWISVMGLLWIFADLVEWTFKKLSLLDAWSLNKLVLHESVGKKLIKIQVKRET